jgi:hypothetical protein
LKNFLSIFHPLWRIRHLLYIERDTEPLRWQKISKFFHRLLRFDSPALRLTKTSWVWKTKRPVTGISSMGLCARVVTWALRL